jgi:hypothetical protein
MPSIIIHRAAVATGAVVWESSSSPESDYAEAKPSSGHVMWVPLAILGVLLFLVGVGVSAWKLTSGAGGSAGSVDPRTVRTTVHSPTGMNPGPAPGALPLPPHGGAPIPYVP